LPIYVARVPAAPFHRYRIAGDTPAATDLTFFVSEETAPADDLGNLRWYTSREKIGRYLGLCFSSCTKLPRSWSVLCRRRWIVRCEAR